MADKNIDILVELRGALESIDKVKRVKQSAKDLGQAYTQMRQNLVRPVAAKIDNSVFGNAKNMVTSLGIEYERLRDKMAKPIAPVGGIFGVPSKKVKLHKGTDFVGQLSSSLQGAGDPIQRKLQSIRGTADQVSQSFQNMHRDIKRPAQPKIDMSAFGKAKSSIDSTALSLENFTKKAVSASQRGGRGGGLFDPMAKSAGRASRKIHGLADNFNFLAAAIVGVGFRSLARGFTGMVDGFTGLENKIAVVTDSTAGFNVAMDAVFDIANRARSSVESVGVVYSRTARAVQHLGKSQAQTLQFTETLSKAVKVGGSTAVESSNAMIQLSQGLSSGTLRGDELRSVLEQMPVVADLIAKKLGITIGALREFGKAGLLTSNTVFEALLEGTAEIDEKFSKLRLTFGQAFEVLTNKAKQAAGQFQGTVGKMADGLIFLGDNFQEVVKFGTTLAELLAVTLAARAIPMARAAMVSLNLVVAANPFVAAAAAVAAATVVLVNYSDKISVTSDGLVTLADVGNSTWSSLKKGAAAVSEFFSGELNGSLESVRDVMLFMAEWSPFGIAIKNIKNLIRVLGDLTGAEAVARARVQKKLDEETKRAGDRQRIGSVDDFFRIQSEQRTAEEKALSALQQTEGSGIGLANTGAFDDKGKALKFKAAPRGKTADDILRELNDDFILLGRAESRQTEIEKRVEGLLDGIKRGALKEGEIRAAVTRNMAQETVNAVKNMTDSLERAVVLGNMVDDEERVVQGRIDAKLDKFSPGQLNEQQEARIEMLVREVRLQEVNRELAKKRAKEEEQALKDQAKAREALQKAQRAPFESVISGAAASMSRMAVDAVLWNKNIKEGLNNLARNVASGLLTAAIQVGAKSLIGGGFSSGGYTGNGGVNDVAGLVHGQEMVINAKNTAKFRPQLEMMNKGIMPVAANTTSAPVININNNAGVIVETESVSRDEVNVMIRRGVANQAGSVVASELRNPNSRISKSLDKNTQAGRRR